MNINKLKILSIAICYVVFALWPHTYGMERSEQRDKPARAHQATPLVPAGSIIAFAGEVAPAGWLLCDGRECSSREYPRLWEVIKMKYVPDKEELRILRFNADEVNMYKLFYIPDLRGRSIVGVDGGTGRVTSNNILGSSGGEETHRLIPQETPQHHHTSGGETVLFKNLPGDVQGTYAIGGGGMIHRRSHQLVTTSSGGDQPHNNMHPYQVLNYIISTGKSDTLLEVEREGKYESSSSNSSSSSSSSVSTISSYTMSKTTTDETSDIEPKEDSLSTNSERGYAKAWVTFNGSATILDNFGVSSVIRDGVGEYTVKFSKPFKSENYGSALSARGSDRTLTAAPDWRSRQTTNNFKFITFQFNNGTHYDPPFVSAIFYGS